MFPMFASKAAWRWCPARWLGRWLGVALGGMTLLGGLTACATPPPSEDVVVARADAAVDRARAMGATRDAPRELYGARVKRAYAWVRAQEGDVRTAERLVDEAVAEADLARERAAAVQQQQQQQQQQQSPQPPAPSRGSSDARPAMDATGSCACPAATR